MSFRIRQSRSGIAALLSTAFVCVGFEPANAQPPVFTKLGKVLVLDKCQGGPSCYMESRRDFNAAITSLAVEKGFSFTTIGQDDPGSRIVAEFSASSLASYQAVLFAYNEGVDKQLDSASKLNLEAYVKNGGGLIALYGASEFIGNWPWLTSVLVQSFYGPHGTNRPTANISHDAEGTEEGTETEGIFKGLTAPTAFLDAYYSFRKSPRDSEGVSILLTVDERSFSQTINAPMGDDHPVAWVKTEGKGRVAHITLGYSWANNNVYVAKDNYLTKFLYGTLRYAAGDFVGCTDSAFVEFNPDATRSDPAACKTALGTSISAEGRGDLHALVSQEVGKAFVKVAVHAKGRHRVSILDLSGRAVETRIGAGPAEYALRMPTRRGLYIIAVEAGGRAIRHRVTVL